VSRHAIVKELADDLHLILAAYLLIIPSNFQFIALILSERCRESSEDLQHPTHLFTASIKPCWLRRRLPHELVS
jgi:hypothetical protein